MRVSRREAVLAAAGAGVAWGRAGGMEYRVGRGVVEQFSASGELVSVTAAVEPVALAVDGAGRMLYVSNGVGEFGGEPRGTVEMFRLEAGTGRPRSVGRQGLSLSGVFPAGLAVSPDGRYLVVAVSGGGAWNVLPVEADGGLGAPCGIRKELAGESGRLPAPRAVLFAAGGGLAVGSDAGADRVSVFAIEGGQLTVRGRIEVPGGPGAMAWVAGGRRLRVELERTGGAVELAWDGAGARLGLE